MTRTEKLGLALVLTWIVIFFVVVLYPGTDDFTYWRLAAENGIRAAGHVDPTSPFAGFDGYSVGFSEVLFRAIYSLGALARFHSLSANPVALIHESGQISGVAESGNLLNGCTERNFCRLYLLQAYVVLSRLYCSSSIGLIARA